MFGKAAKIDESIEIEVCILRLLRLINMIHANFDILF